MKFAQTILWEFLQNLPMFTGFMLAFRLWQTGQCALSILCMAAGSLAGALIIRYTEKFIVAGHVEPWRVVLTNTAVITVLMGGGVLYISTRYSSWATDLALGFLFGFGLSAAQSLSAAEKISLRHCLALGSAFVLALAGIRWLFIEKWPVWMNSLLITFTATLVICLIDYGPLYLKVEHE